MISKAKLKYFSSLKTKKHREESKRFLIEGLRLCEEVLDSHYEVETALFCARELHSDRGQELIETLRRRGIPTLEFSHKDLKHISETVQSQGIICVVKNAVFDLKKISEKPPGVFLAVDEINDPGNLGAIIRTANWFGAKAIFLSENSVELTNPKVVRASMGGLFHLPIFENCAVNEIIDKLRAEGYAIWVADANSDVDYRHADFGERNVLVLGNESEGVKREIVKMADGTLSIPKRGKGESLNVAVAAGILLAEMTRGRK